MLVFDKLWVTMKEKGISQYALINEYGFSSSTINSLRQNISMVFQDNFLYSGTIRENIMMGNYNATEEDTLPRIEQTKQFIDRVLGLIK